MPSGGRRPGAGRKPGIPNKASRERIEAATGMSWEQIAQRRRQRLLDAGYIEAPPQKRPQRSRP